MGNRGNLNLIIAVLFVVVLFMGVGLSYLSSRPVQDMATVAMDANTPNAVEEIATDSALPIVEARPSVVFEPAAAFPDDLKSVIMTRVLNPYEDYYAFVTGDGPVISATVHFSATVQDEKEVYPYTVDFVHQNEAKHSVGIQKDTDGIGWWTPICEPTCLFSPEFEQKYPDIVSRSSTP
jgi:hypothetical protein